MMTNDSVCYKIEHDTRFHYASDVQQCSMLLCMQPCTDHAQHVLEFEIKTEPSTELTSEIDAFGNIRHVMNLRVEHAMLGISTRSMVELAPTNALPEALGDDAWQKILAWKDSFAHWDFLSASPLVTHSPTELETFMQQHEIKRGDDPLQGLLNLSDTLRAVFEYAPGSTSVQTPVTEILTSKRGVCQDYTHVMIAIARSWGIPSRYVSGYLYVIGDHFLEDNATHAWAECLLPDIGWIGFDPTNHGMVDHRYIRIASGRDYQDVPPTRGVLRGGGESRVEVNVSVRPTSHATKA